MFYIIRNGSALAQSRSFIFIQLSLFSGRNFQYRTGI